MKTQLLITALCISVLAGCGTTPPKPNPAVYGAMDEFLSQLADRAKNKIGTADDFRIVVTQAQYPIGTLMHAGSTIPIDYAACIPAALPPKVSTPNLFPSYALSEVLAVSFGLGNDVISKLANSGISIKHTDTINLSVNNVQIQTLADNDLRKLLLKKTCKGAITEPHVWLIRGYIVGQRSFVLKDENVRNIKGSIGKVSTFSIDVNSGNSSVSITDENEKGFLQIVSQIDLQAPKGKQVKALVLDDLIPVVAKVQATGAPNHVYIQSDKTDSGSAAESIAKLFGQGAVSVPTTIEKVDSSQMPPVAQVRYFNDDDKGRAQKVLQDIKEYYPDAASVRIGLPAPSGQLEVWLPKKTEKQSNNIPIK